MLNCSNSSNSSSTNLHNQSLETLNLLLPDKLHVGKDKTKCEIIVYGTLDARPEINKPIKVSSINDHNLNKLTLDKNTQILKFYPYKIETEGLREEFRSFKIQYIVLWSLIYGLWVLRR